MSATARFHCRMRGSGSRRCRLLRGIGAAWTRKLDLARGFAPGRSSHRSRSPSWLKTKSGW